MLLLLPLTINDCCVFPQTGDGNDLRPVKLHYFDHLLQENMMGMAVCEDPAMSPLVTCRATHVTVKLPRETKLKKVKGLGKDHMAVSMHAYFNPPLISLIQLINQFPDRLPDTQPGYVVASLKL